MMVRLKLKDEVVMEEVGRERGYIVMRYKEGQVRFMRVVFGAFILVKEASYY